MNPDEQFFHALSNKLRIKQLRLIMTIEQMRSLHKTAEAMFITQSAASKSLQDVETMLGTPLFSRTNIGLVPNSAGHCAIRYAKSITTELKHLCTEIQDIQSGTHGMLSVGSIMGSIPTFLVPALDVFARQYPDISVKITEGTSGELMTGLENGLLDMVIGRSIVRPDLANFHYHPISNEPTSVVVGDQHPHITRRMKFSELRGYRWVVYTQQMPLRLLLEKEMDLAGLQQPRNTIETNSTFATLAILRKSHQTAALLPTDVARMFVDPGLIRILPIKLKTPANTFGVVTRKGGATTDMEQLFVQAIAQQANRSDPSSSDSNTINPESD